MKSRLCILLAAALAAPAVVHAQAAATAAVQPARTGGAEAIRGNPARWSQAQANNWYAKQPWLTGANYINAGSINQLRPSLPISLFPAHRSPCSRAGGSPSSKRSRFVARRSRPAIAAAGSASLSRARRARDRSRFVA